LAVYYTEQRRRCHPDVIQFVCYIYPHQSVLQVQTEDLVILSHVYRKMGFKQGSRNYLRSRQLIDLLWT